MRVRNLVGPRHPFMKARFGNGSRKRKYFILGDERRHERAGTHNVQHWIRDHIGIDGTRGPGYDELLLCPERNNHAFGEAGHLVLSCWHYVSDCR